MKKYYILTILLLISTFLSAQRVLSLQESRDMALDHNQKIKASKAKLQSYESGKKAMFTNFLPSLNFDGGIQYIGDPQAIDIPSLPTLSGKGLPSGNWTVPIYKEFTNNTVYKMNMGITQPIYTGGKIRNAYKASKLGVSIAASNVVYESSEMIFKTDKQYWLVVSLKEKQELAKKFKLLLVDLVKDLENMYEAELITWNEVLKAKVKFNEADLLLLKANNGVVLSKMALNQVIGLDINEAIDVQDSVSKGSLTIELIDFQQKAINQRAEIKMLTDKLALGKAQVKIVNSNFMPQLGVGANYFYQNPTHLGEDKGEFSWNVGASLKIPVFHWNERKHKVSQARLKNSVSEFELQEAKEMISLEAQQAYFQLSESLTKVDLTELSVEQAKESLKLTRNQFDEGLSTTTEVLNAQVLWEKAYSEYIDSKIEFKLNYSAFKKAIGELYVGN